MKDAEQQQIITQLRDKTDAILQRDLDVLNRLDDVMAEAAEKTREGEQKS